MPTQAGSRRRPQEALDPVTGLAGPRSTQDLGRKSLHAPPASIQITRTLRVGGVVSPASSGVS